MSVVPANECDCPIFNPACFNIVTPATGGTTVQAGTTSAITTLTGSVTFTTPFASIPKVIISLNVNGTTIFIPIGVSSVTTTGFTWASATTSAVATITWFATL